MTGPDDLIPRLMHDLDVRTQGELAQLLNVSPGTISRWRTASAVPHDRKLARSLLDLGLDPAQYGVRVPVGVMPTSAARTADTTQHGDTAAELERLQTVLATHHEQITAALRDIQGALNRLERRAG